MLILKASVSVYISPVSVPLADQFWMQAALEQRRRGNEFVQIRIQENRSVAV